MTPHDQIATGLAKIGMFLRSQAWQQAGPAALTPTQAQILVHLVRRGPARVGMLAAEIAVTQPTASDAASALIRKGLVERRADPADGRAAMLHATDAARAVTAESAAWPDALLAATEVLDADERAALLKGLTKMIRTLQVHGEIPIQRMCATCSHFRPHAHADVERPHHCGFVNAAFGTADLRLDCGDHVEADVESERGNWSRFAEAAT